MNDLDPRAIRYSKSHRERRKRDDPSYKGPERRLGKRRERQLYEIIGRLTREGAADEE
jgi:hypothetical protein